MRAPARAGSQPLSFSPLPPHALESCRAIGRVFAGATDVVLTTHVNPDGDGLGAEAALAAYLRRSGKRARILNADPPPRQFRFLATSDVPLGVYRGFEEDELATADVLVVLDTAVPERLGRFAAALPKMKAARVCIDHHAAAASGELNLVDSHASSTCELVYRLLVTLGAELDRAVAVPLYVGIAFDTGSFRYANTTPETHLVAADLCRRGAEPELLYERLFATHTPARQRLWGRALSSLALDADGRLAWIAIDGAALEAAGATREDLEGLVEEGRKVEGVEISVLFREDGPRSTKVSFRSVGGTDVNALAGLFGGGGHRNASGATVEAPLAEAVERVLAAARSLLARRDGGRGGPALAAESSAGAGEP